jgi:hypothetical protein
MFGDRRMESVYSNPGKSQQFHKSATHEALSISDSRSGLIQPMIPLNVALGRMAADALASSGW